MKVNFDKPLVPNFIRTDKGLFPLSDFSDDEIGEYVKVWTKRLLERRKELRNISKPA